MTDSPIRVMLVDDTDHVRKMLATMLSVDGFEIVAEASDGVEAVSEANAADPDVIVIDYKMPGIDGLETARRLKASRPDQLMVLYTAFVEPDVFEEAKEAGVSLCLAKIDGLESLERQLSQLCRPLAS